MKIISPVRSITPPATEPAIKSIKWYKMKMLNINEFSGKKYVSLKKI